MAQKMKQFFYQAHLRQDEEVLCVADQHLLTRLKAHLLFLAVMISGGVAVGYVLLQNWPPTVIEAVALSAFPLGLVTAYFLAWSMLLVRRGLLCTNQRILVFENDIFSRRIESLDYNKIVEFEVQQNFVGGLLGYGHIRLSLYEMKNKELRTYRSIHEVERILTEYAGR